MHVAIAVGTMLLGGWVLNAPTDEEEAGMPDELQTPATAPSTGPSTNMPFSPSGPRATRDERGRRQGTPTTTTQAGRAAAQRSMMMPGSPTDSTQTFFGGPTAPTAAPQSGPVSAMGQASMANAQPRAPTAGQDAYHPVSRSILDQRRGAAAMSNVSGAMGHQNMEKAFASFRPTSGVSPYMNLFRSQGETLDNYTSLVRPQIEQRFMNQQFTKDIRGLSDASRMQGVNMQMLYRTNQTLQGVATPQYYMNYGNYYPQ